jgi:hypothetical protein
MSGRPWRRSRVGLYRPETDATAGALVLLISTGLTALTAIAVFLSRDV